MKGLDIQRIGNTNLFDAHGLESGNYRVSVMVLKNTIKSDHIRMEVFPIISLHPNDLLIYPGGKWTIVVKGGPHGKSKSGLKTEYTIDKNEIAETNQYGEILAKKVGDAHFYMKMEYKHGEQILSLAERSIKIRVRLVTSIEIPIMNDRSVFVGSLSRINIKLKHENSTFITALGPVTFDWKTSTPQVYGL